jgi:hypothetical protein
VKEEKLKIKMKLWKAIYVATYSNHLKENNTYNSDKVAVTAANRAVENFNKIEF